MEENLPKAEFDALKFLIRNKELIIQQADQGNTAVLLNKKDYISKMKHNVVYYGKCPKEGCKTDCVDEPKRCAVERIIDDNSYDNSSHLLNIR